MKNWEPLVFGPELAMARRPTLSNFTFAVHSSWKGFPQMDSPPRPVPVGSPHWTMKLGMTRWKMMPL